LVINAEEAIMVRRIFTMYLELGSLAGVADELARLGWKNKLWHTRKGTPKGGREFDATSVHSLLVHPLYIGRIKHKSETYAGQHEAIIDEKIFEQVQTLLRSNNNSRSSRLPGKSGGLLKGLIRCPNCNVAMVHNITRRKTRSYRYYTCLKAIKRGRKACTHPSLPAAEIEAAVIEQVSSIAADEGLRREIVTQAEESVAVQKAEFEKQRLQLTRQLDRDHTEVRQLSTASQYSTASTSRLAELHDRIDRSERQLKVAIERIAEIDAGLLTEDEVAAAFEDFDQVWKTLSIREQAELLQLLVAKVEFDQRDCTIAISFHASGIASLENLQVEEVQ
jgi:site-specific DNA recombinase